MAALEIYKAQYEEESTWFEYPMSKCQWVAHRVFDLVTYDDDLDERFTRDILEVCKAIINQETYEYIRDGSNYVKYIAVCQLLINFHWLNWGTSIRGAWFEIEYSNTWSETKPKNTSKDILEELEWWDVKHHIIEKVPFSVENLRDLIEFVED